MLANWPEIVAKARKVFEALSKGPTNPTRELLIEEGSLYTSAFTMFNSDYAKQESHVDKMTKKIQTAVLHLALWKKVSLLHFILAADIK